jgi:DNA-binding CsgD family transcriptional regulator
VRRCPVAAGPCGRDRSRLKEIARELDITEDRVKIHLSRVYEKLGIDNCAALTRWAHTHGLL